jgi:hypothetical protein
MRRGEGYVRVKGVWWERRARGGNGFYALYFGEAASQLEVIIFRLERQTALVGVRRAEGRPCPQGSGNAFQV